MKEMTGNQSLNTPGSVSKGLLVVSAATALILLIPLVAMQFTNEVAWTGFDFAVAAVLLAGTGGTYVVARRKLVSRGCRLMLGAALAIGFLLVWAELAVGILGNLPFSGT